MVTRLTHICDGQPDNEFFLFSDMLVLIHLPRRSGRFGYPGWDSNQEVRFGWTRQLVLPPPRYHVPGHVGTLTQIILEFPSLPAIAARIVQG